MQPNLKSTPPPYATLAAPTYSLSRSATYGLVFSLTIAGTISTIEIYKRVTLPALPFASPNATSSASEIQENILLVPTAANPLEALIAEIHADIPDEVWARLPPHYAADIDKHVYRT